jgi:hypothetical protein
MICKNYSELSPFEKIMFIGELTHACMFDDELFRIGNKLIETAKAKGVFDSVKIMPENLNNPEDVIEN